MDGGFSYKGLNIYKFNTNLKPNSFHLGRFLLTFQLICFVMMGLVGLTHNATAQEAPVFSYQYEGTSPPVADSSGTLLLKEDLENENVFHWKSSDSILGDVDTGIVEASRWNYLPGSPARLVFVGSCDGVTIYGNILFQEYNRAVVNVRKGLKRVRYLLKAPTALIEWLAPQDQEVEFAVATTEEENAPFAHKPGQPGGRGGFGGHPVDSEMEALVDPFRIENLMVSDEGNVIPATMALTLSNNVSEWSQDYTLEETTADSDIFVDAEDSLAIQVLEYSAHDVDAVDKMQVYVVSMAFGAMRFMTLYETQVDTETFHSERLQLVVTMDWLPSDSTVDTIYTMLTSNLSAAWDEGMLTETEVDTNVFKNVQGTFTVAFERITDKGPIGRDDFTAVVSNTLLGVKDTRVDAIETTADSLEFRTDALSNQSQPGTGPGAFKAIGQRWHPAMPDEETWNADRRVWLYRLRGAERVHYDITFLQCLRAPDKGPYHYVKHGDKKRLFVKLVDQNVRPGRAFGIEKDWATVKAYVEPGDKLGIEWPPNNKPFDEVIVVTMKINLAPSRACDGESVNVDLDVTPSSAKNRISNVQFTATEPGGGTNFDNPSGQGITISQRDSDITQWEIDIVRWYSTQADHCNVMSYYEIKASYSLDGDQYETPVVTFTADTTFGQCLSGSASNTNIFSGSPNYTTVFNRHTALYETTVSQGTFVRDVQAVSTWSVPANSQYHDMVRDEELFHEQQQMENPNHTRWGTAFLVANIMNSVQASQPYPHPIQSQSLALAEQAFLSARDAEEQRSNNYLNQQSVICADEGEAKNAVGASHRVDMPCAYPNCP